MSDFRPGRYHHVFPHVAEGSIYMNHAALGPIPTVVMQAVRRALENRQTGAIDSFEQELPVLSETREQLSRLIGAEGGHQIAYMHNTTTALNMIAGGLDFSEGDEVLLFEEEFPSNVYPWLTQRRRGLRPRFIPSQHGGFSLDDIAARITPKTRVLALSAVQFLSGFRAPLPEICELCHQHGVLVVADGIQASGIAPVNVARSGVDAYCSGAHKWLLSPQGIGFMYLNDGLRDRLQLTGKGWLSVEDIWDLFNFEQENYADMKRFEGGTYNIPAVFGLNQSLKLLDEIGIARIRRHVLGLHHIIEKPLREAGCRLYGSEDDAFRAGIITFDLPESVAVDEVQRALERERVYASVRNQKLRFSPFFYTTADQAERAASAVLEVLNKS
ncbi:MAG: aminotransferase class V-fold PLP-dependent enzyme [Cyclonatronaceae bacterium]